jgi:predicted ATP-binding protein involved in virulence
MLLTFPTKESLLRKIQESDPNQKYLIVANYRALANWNLIPLSELTVLLGPNSAGKSTVFDALDGLRMLIDGIRNDTKDLRVDKHYDSMRDEGQPSSIGFSGPFPNIEKEIIDICNNASLYMM